MSANYKPQVTKLPRGGDYLTVAERVQWLRHDYPEAVISCRIVELSPDIAIVHATVTLPNGASADGIGSETPKDFKDHIEKSQTKAIGRALGFLGYGTLAALSEERDNPQIVDAPQERRAAPAAPARLPRETPPDDLSGEELRQRGKALGFSNWKEILSYVRQLSATPIDRLTRRQVLDLAEQLRAEENAIDADAGAEEHDPHYQAQAAVWDAAAVAGWSESRVMTQAKQLYRNDDVSALSVDQLDKLRAMIAGEVAK